MGPSRNLGLQLARYEYVTFLDSDDWWDRHYLEEMLKPVQKMGPDIVCCDIHYWEKNENGKTSDSVSKLDSFISPNRATQLAKLPGRFLR